MTPLRPRRSLTRQFPLPDLQQAFDLGNDLFGHLVHLDAPFYGRTPTGDIMSRMTNDLSAVRMAAGPAYMYLVNTLVGTIIGLTMMVWIDPWLTLMALITAPDKRDAALTAKLDAVAGRVLKKV